MLGPWKSIIMQYYDVITHKSKTAEGRKYKKRTVGRSLWKLSNYDEI